MGDGRNDVLNEFFDLGTPVTRFTYPLTPSIMSPYSDHTVTPVAASPEDLAKGAVKLDMGKPDLSIVPLALLEAAARAFTYGAKKYTRDNYRKGFDTNRLVAALLRHLFAWQEGEDLDPESGLCHLDHVAACIGMLVTTIKAGTATDGRGTK